MAEACYLTFLESYGEQYGRYIRLIDHLKTFGLDNQFALPQVVVTGIQSSGKSSVLESISGVSLPRGTGTVTRTPVELRLCYDPDPEAVWSGRLQCKYDSGEKHSARLRDPTEVARAIEKATVFLAGDSGISDKPIVITIKAHNVPDLTLIDLPGLIETPMEGQPEDICQRIEGLVCSYIIKPEALILVVVSANTEIATTKALSLARSADPEGKRTIGVLTKVDLVDRGAEKTIVDMATNPVKYKIEKGFVLVKLRSQEDIDKHVTLQEAANNERRYFNEQAHYQSLSDTLVGMGSLSNKLTCELVERIKEVLPRLKTKTQERMKKTEDALDSLGGNIPKEHEEKRKYTSLMFLDFTKALVQICDGQYQGVPKICGGHNRGVPTDMRLLLRTRPVMEQFAKTLTKMMPSTSDGALLKLIGKEIKDHRTVELPNFLPYRACQQVICTLLEEYLLPANQCLADYNHEVDNFLRKLTDHFFTDFPPMQEQVQEWVETLRKAAFNECKAAIAQLFEIEYMVIIPDVLFFRMAADFPEWKWPPAHGTDYTSSNITLQETCAYFKSALDRITAAVPMRIHYTLIKVLSRTIERHMTTKAFEDGVVELLLVDEENAKKRRDLEETLACLSDSYKELCHF